MSKIKKFKIPNDIFWNKKRTKWRQPPVAIKIGDLVDVDCKNYPKLLGRYIGKGMGAAIVHLSGGSEIVIGHVVGRGLDANPKLVNDYELYKLVQENVDSR